MKVFEILSLNPEFLKRLHELGIRQDDYQWIGLYREYRQMKDAGEKMVYIVALLADRYHICERKVYKVIQNMERECQIGAVL